MIFKASGLDNIECDKVIKGSDYIKVLDVEENLIIEFLGVTSFNGFSIEGGEFSQPELTEMEQVQLALVELAEMILESNTN